MLVRSLLLQQTLDCDRLLSLRCLSQSVRYVRLMLCYHSVQQRIDVITHSEEVLTVLDVTGGNGRGCGEDVEGGGGR
jgi:hypothetical protein